MTLTSVSQNWTLLVERGMEFFEEAISKYQPKVSLSMRKNRKKMERQYMLTHPDVFVCKFAGTVTQRHSIVKDCIVSAEHGQGTFPDLIDKGDPPSSCFCSHCRVGFIGQSGTAISAHTINQGCMTDKHVNFD